MNHYAPGDRASFPNRRDLPAPPTVTGTVLYTTAANGFVLYDPNAGRPHGTTVVVPLADLTPLDESPGQHAAALRRAADWFREHPDNFRPDMVTNRVDPAAAGAMAEFEAVLKNADHKLQAMRRDLDRLASDLREYAADAKDAAAQADIDNADDSVCDAEHWAGRAADLMNIHGRIMAVLTADRLPVHPGDEVHFLWPDQATPALADIDCHYDVMRVENGMAAVQRTIYRARGEMRGAWHWSPLTAVERVSVGHRCPDTPVFSTMEGGA